MGRQDTLSESDLFYWLALYLAPGVGAVRFVRLLEHFKAPRAVFQASVAELVRVPRLPLKVATALARFDWAEEVKKELRRVQSLGIKLMTLEDPVYPPRLKEIYNPPPLLWVDGEISEADYAAVAIVGSRGATAYGREASARLAGELASAGVSVVSGMALGIDSAAHQGALKAGGRTLAILGCGVDVIYPKGNGHLFKQIPKQGALISEFRLGTEPEPGFFPLRNRVISGLSLGVVVVEAGSRSGALITARLALEQNREVFAVPGRVASAKSQGAHALLKQGAHLVETAQDVLDEIAPQIGRISPKPKPMASEPKLEGEAGRVWEALSGDPLHVDKLGRMTGLTPPRLASLLLDMELNGLIRQLPGMRYTRI
ncbi:MAG: DNA-protecting protein DprA [Deltaproteobacteria bacterium]|nr:DNA-protecting protein DprA [Deltaproteobacteria bacterium]MBW2085652.1 DNA-protecting protein DprA [Deltaproteobacteria bacterium]